MRTALLPAWSGQVFAVLRIVSGFLFTCHGLQKVFGMFGGMDGSPAPVGSPPWVSGVIELVAGILIATGTFAAFAAFIASGEMAVAYFKAHFQPDAFWPIENRGELAVLYCFLFLYIAARGSGPWSVDAALARGRGGGR